jgi:hypothetical protein
MSDRQDELERFLDDALESYAEAPESEGLEQRILIRVAESTRWKHSVTPLTVTASAALLAAIAFVFWWSLPKSQTKPTITAVVASKQTEPSQLRANPALAPPAVLKLASKVRKRERVVTTPKLARFPTPSPMSSEERALLRLVTGGTRYISNELTKSNGPIEPIQITAFDIHPLGFATKQGEACCDH